MKSLKSASCVLLLLCGSAAAQDHSYTVSGLEQEAEIIVDEWGVPHIYANTHYDAFFVQGFNAARDRLWQIDVWRRRGLGQLSEVFGADYLDQDRATRLFLYRGDMYREWLAYGSDAKRIAEAFTSGINAYIDLIDEHPKLLPPEFDLLDYRPAHWSPSDVVRIRSHGLLGNAENEIQRARIACVADLDTAAIWRQLEPNWTTKIPDGLDPCVVPADVLKTYFLAKSPVSFTMPSIASLDSDHGYDDRADGSNNWAIAPSLTSTGRAILANDPHRGHSVPSLRYISHLVAPGMNVIGAGEPSLPGISIGHNESIAFGLTIFLIDQEDVYVYEKNGSNYRYADGWEPFRTVSESLAVRGTDNVEIELKFTRHGPLVYETEDHAFAVRAGWLEPGMAPYFGSIEYMRASNWREFHAAMNRWGAPPENQVYADIDGNIGYKPGGLFPRRPNWDGLLPVPGDGRYEWDGFFDMDVLPVEYNPGRGFTGSANSMNLPDDYPIDKYKIGFEWVEPWRYQRIWEVLESQVEHKLGDSFDLQRDYRSLRAIEIIRRIPADAPGPAAEMLRNWDGVLSPESGPAALYMIWLYGHLQPALVAEVLPQNPGLLWSLDSRSIIRMMTEERMHATVISTLSGAYAAAESLLGDDPSKWAWGTIHKTVFTHPLRHLAGGELAEQMTFASYPRGGSAHTTNNTASYTNEGRVNHGASYRQVLDVGNWDAATMTNAPGQSGDPRSPFYDNLLKGWAADGAFPLLYSRDKVLAHEAITIQLRPK
jgi:penicillin amidase